MKTLLIYFLTAISCLASSPYYYAEVQTNGNTIACIEFTSFADASNAIPDIVSEFGFTNYTAQVHKHTHYAPDTPNVPCEITPMSDTAKSVTVETVVDTTHRLAEYVTLDAVDDADAVKVAEKVKKSKWFVGKETTTKVKDK